MKPFVMKPPGESNSNWKMTVKEAGTNGEIVFN